MKKDYKLETLFVAASIFDRYIYKSGVWRFPKIKVICLATISMLMAAKLEQPISPSFSRMIALLTEEEQKLVKLLKSLYGKNWLFNWQGQDNGFELNLQVWKGKK